MCYARAHAYSRAWILQTYNLLAGQVWSWWSFSSTTRNKDILLKVRILDMCSILTWCRMFHLLLMLALNDVCRRLICFWAKKANAPCFGSCCMAHILSHFRCAHLFTDTPQSKHRIMTQQIRVLISLCPVTRQHQRRGSRHRRLQCHV